MDNIESIDRLKKLNNGYENLICGPTILEEEGISPMAIFVISKERRQVYSGMTANQSNAIQCEIVKECEGFVKCANIALSNPKLHRDDFIHILTMTADAHKQPFGMLDEENKIKVLESSIESITGIFKRLKNNPMKAKVEITATKRRLNELKAKHDKLVSVSEIES